MKGRPLSHNQLKSRILENVDLQNGYTPSREPFRK